MSKVAITGNASGTGTLTIAAPNTNSDRTLTLPDGSGALYNQSNILGTVSQSGGVPTGAIIERGSNANGEYVKFADGTMICTRHDFSIEGTSTVLIDNIWTFPSTFVDDELFASLTPPSSSAEWTDTSARNNSSYQFMSSESTTSVVLGLFLISNKTVTVSNCHVCAIGRWY